MFSEKPFLIPQAFHIKNFSFISMYHTHIKEQQFFVYHFIPSPATVPGIVTTCWVNGMGSLIIELLKRDTQDDFLVVSVILWCILGWTELCSSRIHTLKLCPLPCDCIRARALKRWFLLNEVVRVELLSDTICVSITKSTREFVFSTSSYTHRGKAMWAHI